jgi:hypothetical protein
MSLEARSCSDNERCPAILGFILGLPSREGEKGHSITTSRETMKYIRPHMCVVRIEETFRSA